MPCLQDSISQFISSHDGNVAVCLSQILFRLCGSDAATWLQGQITNDIILARPGQPVEFCICTPTGHVEAMGRLWQLGSEICLSLPLECADVFANRVENFVILEDVELHWMELSCVHFYPFAGRIDSECVVQQFEANRFGKIGIDCWVQPSEIEPISTNLLTTEHEMDAKRIINGIPDFALDVVGKVLAPEFGAEFIAKNISYTKGCYVGQEVIHRIYSRGHTNRTWRLLQCEKSVDIGSPVCIGDGTECGVVTSAAVSKELGAIAAGFIKNQAAEHENELWVQGVKCKLIEFRKP